MRKQFNFYFFIHIFIALFFTACENNFFDFSSEGSIVVSLPYSSINRAAESSEENSLYFVIRCNDSNGTLISEKNASSGEQIVFDSLQAGNYVISAEAYFNEEVQLLMYAGTISVAVEEGESKDVSIVLKYVGPKTELPIDLYTFQDRNNCVRIRGEGELIYADTENEYKLKPVYFYWYNENGLISELCGENVDMISMETHRALIGDYETLGLIVKFEDGSYAVRSFLVDYYFEQNVKIQCEYTKAESTDKKKGTFTYSFNYPNVSDSNKIKVQMLPLEKFSDGEAVTGNVLTAKNTVNGTYHSPAGMSVATTRKSFSVEMEPGWYIVETELSMFNDGYSSSSVADIYKFVAAVYVAAEYELSYVCDFPFSEYYDKYWYKINWDLAGGSWPTGADIPEYILLDYPQSAGTFEFSVPIPIGANATKVSEEMVISPDCGIVEYDDEEDVYKVILEVPVSYNNSVTILAKWSTVAGNFESLSMAVADSSATDIYLDARVISFDSTLNLNRSVNFISLMNDGTTFQVGSSYNSSLFKIQSDEEIAVNFGAADSPEIKFGTAYSGMLVNSAIYVSDENATVNFTNCSFTDLKASSNGGAIYCENGKINITASTFSNNSSQERGGAIYMKGDSTLTISQSSFDSNEAKIYGGAIHCEYTDLIVSDTSFTGNSVTDYSDGGAMWIGVGNRTDLSGLTFSGNNANGTTNNISLYYYESKKDNLNDYLTLDADLEAAKQPGVGNSYIF